MNPEFLSEPERYELTEGPAYTFALTRRDFLRFGGAGLVVLVAASQVELRAQETAQGAPATPVPPPNDVSGWLHIDEHGRITAFTGKVEIGQNIRTSLAQAVADELGTSLASVTMVMGDTDLTPWDFGTVGSFTTPQIAPALRRAAATARQMLLELAAERWRVPVGELTTAEGRVLHTPTTRSAGFGELTQGQRLARQIATDQATLPVAQWTLAGAPLKKVDGRSVVTGTRKYISDMTRPGMLHGTVVRPPAIGASLASVDDAAARRMPGAVVVRDGNFLGVAAPKPWTAQEAARAVTAQWTPQPGQPSTTTIFDYLKAHAEKPEPRAPELEAALGAGAHRLDREYTVQFIAHVPLEPRAAVAEWNGDTLTVWTGTQRPFVVREELALAFRIPSAQVRVIVPDFGSGYGGKHTGETAVEAARLAKATGKPVKVVWTRAEEFQWAYFRPAGVITIASAMSADGRLTAWHMVNYHSGRSAIDPSIYTIQQQKTQFVTLAPPVRPLRSGSYRALAAGPNTFAREAHIDEMAVQVKVDPLAFRLANLKDPRARAVLEAAAERFKWGTRPAAGRGAGLAVSFDKGGYVATCVELERQAGRDEPTITRVVVAYECGAIVNPDGLRHQILGGVIQGLGGALFEGIDFADGRVLNGTMRQYRVPRFADVPPIDVVMVNRKDLPSAGAGETPLIALAPAIANALFQATGERRRSLPLVRRPAPRSGQSTA